MEAFTDHNLPVIDLLPQFMLGLLIISLFELAWVHFRLRQAKLGEYAMAFKAMGFRDFEILGANNM